MAPEGIIKYKPFKPKQKLNENLILNKITRLNEKASHKKRLVSDKSHENARLHVVKTSLERIEYLSCEV